MKARLALLALALCALPRTAVAQPHIAVDPAGLDFGPVLRAAASTRVVLVSNQGASLLTVSRAAILDPYRRDPSPWGLGDDRFTVAPGGSHPLAVEFHPLEVGSFPAELELSSDDPAARTTRVALDGRGVEASWSVTPAGLAFRSLLIGDVSAPQVVTLANRGLVAVQVFAPRLEGPGADQFRVTAAGATTLAPGQSEVYAVTCQPTAPGVLLATLSLSAGGPMGRVVVPLSATAVATTLADPPVDWSFGDVLVGSPSPPRAFTVTLGPPGIAGRLLAVASSNPLFVIDTSATRWGLDPGESTSVTVRFAPVVAGEATALLTVVAAGELAPLRVAQLHGRGVAPPPIVAAEGCSVVARRAGSPSDLWLIAAAIAVLASRRRCSGDDPRRPPHTLPGSSVE